MIDLHCHSVHSDGTLTVPELMERARSLDIALLSVTDHDTLGGTEEACAMAMPGVRLVRGVEISARWDNKTLHILGLDVDLHNQGLNSLLSEHQRLRRARSRWFVERLRDCFPGKDLDKVFLSLVGDSLPCRSHVAKALVEGGMAAHVGQAFERWLAKGKRLAVPSEWYAAQDVIRAIKGAGGVAVLAHPTRYRLSNSRLYGMAEELAQAGLDAMELSYPGIDASKQRWLGRLCRSLGLRGSAGSDYHGPEQSWNRLGKYPPFPQGIEPVWLRWLEDAA
jgi:hypothetical protein